MHDMEVRGVQIAKWIQMQVHKSRAYLYPTESYPSFTQVLTLPPSTFWKRTFTKQSYAQSEIDFADNKLLIQMGGRAFANLGEHAFPRIPTEVYAQLKTRFTERLRGLYACVGVPIEAPEKEDHGDVDFIVCEPLSSGPHALASIKSALGAQHVNLAAANRTSNFAIPAAGELGCKGIGKFFQVDVHVCDDKPEWERTLFFHSYGDLGMILGLLARSHGFTLGTKGFKTYFAHPDDSHISSFLLSESFHDILPFLGLSMEEWEQGFSTLTSVFSWVQTSRFFEPRRLVDADPSKAKKASRQQRGMYSAFLEFSNELAVADSAPHSPRSCDPPPDGVDSQRDTSALKTVSEGTEGGKPKFEHQGLLEEALVYFGRKAEYEALVAKNIRRRALREKLNGTRVIAWTGLQGVAIKWIMDGIRERLGEDGIIAIQDDKIRELALDVQTQLGLFPDTGVSLSKNGKNLTVGTSP